MLDVLAASVLSALAVSQPLDRPPPPPDWSARLEAGRLAPGATTVFTYRASSSDALTLRVTLRPLPRGLRFVAARSSPARLVDGRPTWTRMFSGREPVTRTVRIAVRTGVAASPGARLCVTLRQVASNGGVPDVVPVRACAAVRR